MTAPLTPVIESETEVSKYPMLDMLSDQRIFSLARHSKGHFVFAEECDRWFKVKVTTDGLLALSEELRQLALSTPEKS